MGTKKRQPNRIKNPAKANSVSSRSRKIKTAVQTVAGMPQTKTSLIIDLLSKPRGSTIAEMQTAAGWQAHSVHGFLAGTLKKKGLSVGAEGKGAERRYRLLGSGLEP